MWTGMMHRTNNRRISVLSKLYRADLRQRQSGCAWVEISVSDERRARFARAILAARRTKALTPSEAFYVGIILHHAGDYRYALRAAEFARTGGDGRGSWLIAVVSDRRSLLRTGMQLYGTQFEGRSVDSWKPKPTHDTSIRRRPEIVAALTGS